MSKDVYIFDATEANFEQVVLENSNKIPVVTLFMGVWSEHCYVLMEIFSKLAKEFAGEFVFAKVDIDEQAPLRDKYKIVNVPTIKIFLKGNETLTSEGSLTEDEARVILKGVNVFNIIDAMRDKAREKHMSGDTQGAIVLLSEAMQQEPANTKVALDMVQIFIDLKEFEQANALLNKLPEAVTQTDMGKSVTGQLFFINKAAEKESIEVLMQVVEKNENDLQARFDLAICLTAEYGYKEALAHLLKLHQQDEFFQEGAAKELMVTLISMLKETHPEIANKAQQQLSNYLSQ